MVIQHGMDTFPNRYPDYFPLNPTVGGLPPQQVTKADFDRLKQDVEDLASLVRKALKYDEENNQKECEDPKKVQFLAELAKKSGVNIDDLIAQLKQ
jgi:acetyl esterase/lipase